MTVPEPRFDGKRFLSQNGRSGTSAGGAQVPMPYALARKDLNASREFWKTLCGTRICGGCPPGCTSGSRQGTAGRRWFSEPANKALRIQGNTQ